MLMILPPGWKCEIPEDMQVFRRSADRAQNHARIRQALEEGEGLFLIGTEGVSDRNCYVCATDHISLFGGSPLAGENRDDLGPRFPSLMNLYLSPEGSWENGIVGRVPDWKLATPAELSLMGSSALVSSGVDEAEIAGHGGARVMLLARCHGWDSINTEPLPLMEAAEAAVDLHNHRITEGGEEREL